MAKMKTLSNDEMLKLKAVVLYVLNKCEAIDYFHLFKILYFADRDHYAKYGRRIIKDSFIAMENGPVPSDLYNALKGIAGKTCLPDSSPLKIISNSIRSKDKAFSYYITSSECPDMDELSKSDIEMLDRSFEENKNLGFGELSKKSHDFAWEEAWGKSHNSIIDEISMAKAAGASEDMIEYIKENELINSLFCV